MKTIKITRLVGVISAAILLTGAFVVSDQKNVQTAPTKPTATIVHIPDGQQVTTEITPPGALVPEVTQVEVPTDSPAGSDEAPAPVVAPLAPTRPVYIPPHYETSTTDLNFEGN